MDPIGDVAHGDVLGDGLAAHGQGAEHLDSDGGLGGDVV